MRLFRKTYIEFIEKRRFWYVVSITITVAGIAAALFRGVEYGIDFRGGTELAFRFSRDIDASVVRAAMDKAGLAGAEIKSYGQPTDVLIRLKEGQDSTLVSDVRSALTRNIADNQLVDQPPKIIGGLLKQDKIGPKIGGELRLQALYAVLASIVAILIYIAFRFDFVSGLGAVIALVHDVLVAFAAVVLFNGMTPWLNLELNQGMLAAFLTVVGFSINDTVIIFDRIRENNKIHKGMNLIALMNRSINETLSRTVITAGTVFIVLVILLIFGGEVNRGFAFCMLVGITTGTYSSIFIASAFVIDWNIRVRKIDLEKQYKSYLAKSDSARTTPAAV
jgi:preprotein translocase subunit SecF